MAVTGQYAAADWVGTRYFAVDYDAGLDTNLGYSDASMAAAGAVAFKTIERLYQALPRFGAGQTAVVAIKARAAGANYLSPTGAQSDLLLNNYFGYQLLLARGTATQPTAGSVAFANDANERLYCGAQIVPGTNAAGYNPTGAPTTSVFDCQLAGGGAPGLPAEPNLEGKRIRFDANTTTVALRNVCRVITANDTDTITVGPNLPAVPALTDVFYIEEPGVAFARISAKQGGSGGITNSPVDSTGMGIAVAGFRSTLTTGTTTVFLGGMCVVLATFIDAAHTGASSIFVSGVDCQVLSVYAAEDGTFPSTGVGLRGVGGLIGRNGNSFFMSQSALTGANGILNVQGIQEVVVGQDSYFRGMSVLGIPDALLGNAGSATARAMRVVGAGAGQLILVGNGSSSGADRFCGVTFNGVSLETGGANPLINVVGVGHNIGLVAVVGSTGNTGAGLSLLSARDCNVYFGAGNTFTGGAGRDIEGAGPVRYVHADYVRTDLRDSQGNHVQGSGGALVGNTELATNDGNADIGQYKVCRATASGVVRAAIASAMAGILGIVGVSQSAFTAAGPQKAMLASGGATWVQFDAAPSAGDVAYLSDTTAGNARNTPPAIVVPLGTVLAVSGTLGLVVWGPVLDATSPLLATWSGTRYYAVDYDAGSDLNIGYSDVSLADAGTKAFKTFEQLRQSLPRWGNGQTVVIAAKTRAGGATYRNKANTADDDLVLDHIFGYRLTLLRGTATDATAGSVAFANDAADRTFCGARQVAGTNAAGYKVTGAPTAATFDCLTAAGAAPGFAAEPGIIGKRIRFDSNTTTAALRNVCRMIWQNDTDTITVDRNLPAVPAGTDIFYIEEPGLAVNRGAVAAVDATANPGPLAALAGFYGLVIAGVRFVNTAEAVSSVVITAPSFNMSFCQVDHAGTLAFRAFGWNSLAVYYSYIDESGGTPPDTGGGIRANGELTFTGFDGPFIQACAVVNAGRGIVAQSTKSTASIGGGCYLGRFSGANILQSNIGNSGSATQRVMRMVGVGASSRVITLSAGGSFSCHSFRGISFENAGASALMQYGSAYNSTLSLVEVTGSTGNTGVGLDLTGDQCLVSMGPGNTFTGAAGQDIAMRGTVANRIYYVHADWARTNLVDARGNMVMSDPNTGPGKLIGPTNMFTNDGNANIGQYKVCRVTGNGVVRAAIATTLANVTGLCGVSQSSFLAAGPAQGMFVTAGLTWVQFDGAPTAGDVAYLSEATAGNARNTPPVATGTQQIVKLGTVVNVSGTLGLVLLLPDLVPVTTTISPAQITANQNDYGPTDFYRCDVARLDLDANRSVTGFSATNVTRLFKTIRNISAFTLKLVHQSASSAAANRIQSPFLADYDVAPGFSVTLMYDQVNQYWVIL